MEKVSVSGPAELLTIIPFQLGFEPRRSLVAVCFHDKQIGLLARLDAMAREHASAAADQALPAILRDEPTSVMLVGFEDEMGETMPLSDALAAGLGAHGVLVRDRLAVRGDRWFSLACGPHCCPAEGLPLPALPDVPAVASFVATGRFVLQSREAMAAQTAPQETDHRAQESREAITQWQAVYALARLEVRAAHLGFPSTVEVDDVSDEDRTGEDGRAGGEARAGGQGQADPADGDLADQSDLDPGFEADGVPSVFELMVDDALIMWGALLRGELDSHELPLALPALIGPLTDKLFRDALIAWICPGTLPLEQFDDGLVEGLQTLVGPVVRPGGSAPDEWEPAPENVVQEQLDRLCRATPAELAAPVLSVTASFAWWRGDGAKAGICVDRALEIEPEHTLSALIRNSLNHGVRSRISA